MSIGGAALVCARSDDRPASMDHGMIGDPTPSGPGRLTPTRSKPFDDTAARLRDHAGPLGDVGLAYASRRVASRDEAFGATAIDLAAGSISLSISKVPSMTSENPFSSRIRPPAFRSSRP